MDQWRGTLGGLCAAAVLALAATGPVAAVESEPAEEPAVQQDAIGSIVHQRLLDKAKEAAAADAEDREALANFYSARAMKTLWLDEDGFTDKAKAAIAEIKKADDWGLESKAFALPDADFSRSNGQDGEAAANEMALSLAVLKYARHARGGRIPDPTELLSSYLDRKAQLKPPAAVLEEIVAATEADTYLRNLHPQHEGFKILHKKLLALREEAEAEEDVTVPQKGPMLKPGMHHPHVAILRKRLEVAVPEPESTSENTSDSDDGENARARSPEEVYDDELVKAVKAFQRENGLYVDGIVGNGTRRALAGDKAVLTKEVLLANMEAWRWMPGDLGDFHIAVNIPEYTIRVIKNGEVIHKERIITGKTNNQTPVFSDEMETVVFHPFWGVPNSIKVKELLPGLMRGGGSFYKNGLRMQYRGRDINPSSVDWSQADIRRFHVYQPPGRSNVLGVVKFMFPNKHQVYMHDTPTKNLFKQSQRTFSHGCMRVRNPVRLAEIVMEEVQGWDTDKVDSVIRKGPKNNNITLDKKIPVHVTYFTAVADDSGEVTAIRDVYGHEKRIKLALAKKFDLIDKGRDHLAPVKIDRRMLAQKYNQWNAPMNIFDAIFGF